MKHFGDITKISGYDLPIVDVITGGSPCQDLSVAGKRAGLDGSRSSLFLDQIRIVKEMREHDRSNGRTDEFVRPRYMVWENVPGATSSGKPKGADFQIVLTEIAKIADPECPDVPLPNKGKWPKSGCIYDEMGRWSIAWLQHDAQYLNVPQRRKRLALLADFNGLSAPQILFNYQYHGEAGRRNADLSFRDTSVGCQQTVLPVGKGLQGNSEQGEQKREGTAGDSETGSGESDSSG